MFSRRARQAQMFRCEAIDEPDGIGHPAGDQQASVFRERAPSRIRLRQLIQLPLKLGCDGARESRGSRDEERDCLRIMFALSEQIRRDESGISALGEHERFRRPGEKINGTISADQPFRGCDVAIPGAKILSTRGIVAVP